MISGRATWLVLAGFFDCSGGSNGNDPTQSPVNLGAWQSERILFADTSRGALMTVRDDGNERAALIEIEDVACPTVSADGTRIMANLVDSNELVLVRRSGDNSVFAGLEGGILGSSTLTEDGVRGLFHERGSDDSGSCPQSRIVSATTDGTNLTARTPEGMCARWPEIDDTGLLISYEREDPSTGTREICMLDGELFGDAGCLAIAELTGPRAWSPGGEMLMGNDFRTWRTDDGVETSSPLDELKQLMPPAGQNDLRARMEMHMNAMGVAPLAGGRFPLSLDWGPDDRIVFDAVADGPGGTGVHVFIYDLRNDALSHVVGPLPSAGGDEDTPSHVCPRWIP